jgi:oligogalacturonide lyase
MAALSRRAFVGGVAGLLRGELPQTELRRFRDAATEFEVLRYTDPAASSMLGPAHLRSISRGNSFLVFASDRTGVNQLFTLALKGGEARQITSFPEGVAEHSFGLTRDDRAVYCVHAGGLELVPFGRARARTLYRSPAEWSITEAAHFDTAGVFAVVEKREGRYRVRFVRTQTATGETLFESGDPITGLRPRPHRNELVISRAGRISVLQQDGHGPRELATSGRPGQALWTADGASLLYLSFPDQKGKLNEMREHFPDARQDKFVAPTSQFVTFARNSDASVFAGISGSKASPHVLLLLRTTRREMTLSEHKASSPAGVVILFTPDSQRVFYHSDRQGKTAIYAVPADRFVEKTEDRET